MEIFDLENVLQTFAINNNEHCIFISGKWGIGKTHYLREFQKKHIKGTDYKIAYSSCFGKKSTDEINTELYKNIYKDNKTLNILKKIKAVGYGISKQLMIIPPYISIAIDEIGKQFSQNEKSKEFLKQFGNIDITQVLLVLENQDEHKKRLYGREENRPLWSGNKDLDSSFAKFRAEQDDLINNAKTSNILIINNYDNNKTVEQITKIIKGAKL